MARAWKVRRVEDAHARNLDPAEVGVGRIVLSERQARLLHRVVAEGTATIRGQEHRSSDALYDWGFVTGGNDRKTCDAWLRATDRGRRWVERNPRSDR
jgi:hypothetical protein